MKDKIKNIVLESIEEIFKEKNPADALPHGEEIKIFGDGGVLDSIGLVSLIVVVEERIENEFGVDVMLSNEKALSQKRSPFLTDKTLASYVEGLVQVELKNEG